MISLHVEGRWPSSDIPSASLLQRAVKHVFRLERQRVRGAIHAILVDRRTIRRLNRRFLNETGDTDVIAFPYDVADKNSPFADLYICFPVARQNAARFNETTRREVLRLVIHGLLHVLGHDDHVAAKRRRMWRRQELVLDAVLPR